MKQKLFTLLTLLVLCVTGAWADTEICSATLNGITSNANSTGVAQTNCTMKWNSVSSSSDIVTVSDLKYYKFTGGSSWVQLILPSEESFKAGDVVTVVATSNGNNKSVQFSVKSDSGNKCTAQNVSSTATVALTYTLTANDIETDGSIKIYRAGNSAIRFGSFSVSRSDDTRSDITLSFASSSGSVDVTGSTTLPAVSSNPDVAAVTSNITYSTSNSAIATVDESTGALTLKGIGTATITASFAGDTNYKPATATYNLTVTDATKLGYTEVINPDKKTLEPRWLFGLANTTVTQTFANYYGTPAGAIEDNSAQATVYLNGTADANKYTNSRSWKKMQNGYIVDGKEQWVGYDIAVDDNYVLNLTHLDARILVADDTYKWYVEILDKNGTQVYKSAEQTTKKSETANLSTDINVTNLNGTAHVKLWVTQGGSTKYFSIDKLILTGTTAEDTRPVLTVAFAAGEGSGTAPSDVTLREGESFTFPTAPLLYKTDNTLTDWNDGSADHEVGSSVTISGDMDLTAVFTPNTVALGDVATTVDWTFKTSKGAPSIAIEGSGSTPVVYSSRTTLGATPFDALMTIDATDGKFNNESTDTYAQVNAGTKFTIPAVKGMTVTFSCNQNPGAVSDVTFAGNNADAFSTNPRTLTYTYNGTESSIDIVVVNGGLYPDGISVVYPYVKTKYEAPTITVGDFNFENKGYEVTITASEGDLYVAEDGNDFIAKASPYTTYATANTHYYAQAKGNDYGDSDVAHENVANTFDGSKAYVAWVYQKGYSDSSVDYDFDTDELAIGLAADYNVVPVELTQSTDPTTATDIDKADLIVLTEAVKGSNTATDLSNKMKEYVGVTPMIGMKVFAYTYNTDASKNRWGWGTAANNSGKNAFMPKDNTYKIFEGVVFEADGSIKLATTTSGNIIQSVDFTTPATPLSPNTIMGTVGNDDKKAVIHTTTKYLGVGISCNVRENYTPNLIAIVKNAAAILIANGDLTAKADFAKKVTGTITVSGWNSFSSVFPLDLSTITATNEVGSYYASATSGSIVTMTPTDAIVEAGEGLMIKGTAGEDFMIDVATADADFAGTNLLKGLPNGGKVTKDNNNYVFAWPTEAPANCGFYLINDVEPTLPGGKAYLHTTTALTAHELTITFEGETTGISNINVNDNANIDANAPMYNLAGQKVTKSYKGVVIVNGKKVVRK